MPSDFITSKMEGVPAMIFIDKLNASKSYDIASMFFVGWFLVVHISQTTRGVTSEERQLSDRIQPNNPNPSRTKSG
jgi:hypothetical protein